MEKHCSCYMTAATTMTGTHQRAMAVNHDEDPGDIVGHLQSVIALLTVLGVRTRGLRAGRLSLLWPPNRTICKASRRRRQKVSLARDTTVQGGSSEFDRNFGEEVHELSPLGASNDRYYSKRLELDMWKVPTTCIKNIWGSPCRN